MATTLGLDYTTGASANSLAVGRETYEAMDTTFQEEEEEALETSTPMIPKGGTPEPAKNGEGHG